MDKPFPTSLRRRRFLLAPLTVTLLAVGMLLGAAFPAQAAPTTDANEPKSYKIVVPLTVQSTGGAETDDVSRGDCGLHYVEVIPTGGGTVRFEYGFESTLGVVAQRAIRVRWSNLTVGRIDFFQDNSFMISSRYDGSRSVATGAGRIRADMNVAVQLYNLAICVGAVSDIEVAF